MLLPGFPTNMPDKSSSAEGSCLSFGPEREASPREASAGAKASAPFCAGNGTTEVVPCHNTTCFPGRICGIGLVVRASAGVRSAAGCACGCCARCAAAAGCHDHRAASRLHIAGQDGAAAGQKQLPPYFLSYSVSDASWVTIDAQFGALVSSEASHVRVADVQVRVGSPKLDNTHGDHRASAVNSMHLPLGDDREALARTLWLATNTGYGTALDNYLRVKTEAAGAGQGRRHLAGFQPGSAADAYWQARAAGGGG